MTLKTPAFWYDQAQTPTFMQKCMTPISMLYGLAQRANQSLRARDIYRSHLPVICVGNITAGGSGKTPTAISIAQILKAQVIFKSPAFLTRGYGGDLAGPVLVDLDIHTSKEVGDEALLLARHAPTIICANRAEGARFAEQCADIDAIIMDDGMQNPSLHKDLSFLVISGEVGIGNAKLLPAGPLREPLSDGLRKADAVIITGENRSDIKKHLPQDMPVISGALQAQERPSMDLKYLAFAGLGMPSKFFGFLRDTLNLDLTSTRRFADHHPYSVEDLNALQQEAKAQKATLITTEKDAVRLPKIDGVDVLVVPVMMKWRNEEQLVQCLKTITAGERA